MFVFLAMSENFLILLLFFPQNSTQRALKEKQTQKTELYNLTPLQYLLTVWAVVQGSGFHAACLVMVDFHTSE